MRFVPALIALLLVIAGCEKPVLDGPPELKLGRDTCAHCGMIISDARYAAATIANSNGNRQVLLFDDIGDQIDYEAEHKDISPVARYVHDHATREWIRFDAAHYVHAPTLHTPMGSGLIAHRDADAASKAATQHNGRVVSAQQLPEIRNTVASTQPGE